MANHTKRDKKFNRIYWMHQASHQLGAKTTSERFHIFFGLFEFTLEPIRSELKGEDKTLEWMWGK